MLRLGFAHAVKPYIEYINIVCMVSCCCPSSLSPIWHVRLTVSIKRRRRLRLSLQHGTCTCAMQPWPVVRLARATCVHVRRVHVACPLLRMPFQLDTGMERNAPRPWFPQAPLPIGTCQHCDVWVWIESIGANVDSPDLCTQSTLPWAGLLPLFTTWCHAMGPPLVAAHGSSQCILWSSNSGRQYHRHGAVGMFDGLAILGFWSPTPTIASYTNHAQYLQAHWQQCTNSINTLQTT